MAKLESLLIIVTLFNYDWYSRILATESQIPLTSEGDLRIEQKLETYVKNYYQLLPDMPNYEKEPESQQIAIIYLLEVLAHCLPAIRDYLNSLNVSELTPTEIYQQILNLGSKDVNVVCAMAALKSLDRKNKN